MKYFKRHDFSDLVTYNLTLTIVIPEGNYDDTLNTDDNFKDELIKKVCCFSYMYFLKFIL